MRLSVQTDRPSILQRPPHQNLTACESVERKGLVGRVVIGLGYQRVDGAFKAPTCLLSVREGYDMTDSPLCLFDKSLCFLLTAINNKTTYIHNTYTRAQLIMDF